MSIRGLTLSATFTYESPFDEAAGTPEATSFLLGPLDVFVTTHLFDSAIDMKAEGVSFKNNQANLEAVRFGLKGWTNFKDEKGNDIPFATSKRLLAGREYQTVTDDLLALIPFPELRGMAERVRNYSTVTEAEAKNSEGAS